MDNTNDMKDKIDAEGKSSTNDIPLWLQGIEEPHKEDPPPLQQPKIDATEKWGEETTEESPEAIRRLINADDPEDTENDLPDWLTELSREEPAPSPDELANMQKEINNENRDSDSGIPPFEQGEITDEIEVYPGPSKKTPEPQDQSVGKPSEEYMDEIQPNDTSPHQAIKSDSTEKWGEETTEASTEANRRLINTDDPEDTENDLPDWLIDLSKEEHGPLPNQHDSIQEEITNENKDSGSEIQPSFQSEITDEIEVYQPPNTNTPEPIEHVIGKASEEYVEISDLNLAQTEDPEQSLSDDEQINEEGLPPWLQDMIAEPGDETPPVNAETATSDVIEAPKPQIDDQKPTKDNQDLTEDHDKETIKPDSTPQQETLGNEKSTDEKTIPVTPLQDQVIEPIPEITPDEFPPPEQDIIEDPEQLDVLPNPYELEQLKPSDDVPKTLSIAKIHLDHGEYNSAMEIINTYIDQSDYLEEIYDWLTEIVNNGGKNNIAIWESIGDIALKQGKSEDAFNAYAKAIKSLLTDHEDSDESD
jgi:uncharacterized protein (DUF2267 family)